VGTCFYCGQPAGFLRTKHTECIQRHEEGKREIVALITSSLSPSTSAVSVPDEVKKIGEKSFISEAERQVLVMEGWVTVVERSLQDGVLSEDEEKRLNHLADLMSLSQHELNRSNAFTRVVKSAVIRDVLNGIIPHRLTVEYSLPINFQKGEQLVWLFDPTGFLEDRTHREYIGESSGLSLRVMKGVYYRTGTFKGHSVDRTERRHVDTGLLAITSKNIYFSGEEKSFRIPYAKIVAFHPFDEGVGIIRDTANAKLQIFVTGDGWFTYNLVTNLANL
jgi:hypothetical protein